MPPKKNITYQSLVAPTNASPLFNRAEETARQVDMTPYQRKEKKRQQSRNKQAFDLRPDLSKLIDDVVESFKTTPASTAPFSKSALVELLIINGVQSIEQSHGDLYTFIEELLRPTTTPRFEWQLEMPPVPDSSVIRKRKR